jgi:hypothetical protein
MVAAVVSGYALGYYWGYNDEANCDSDEFRRQFSEPKFWQDVGVRLKTFYFLKFSTDGTGNVWNVSSHRPGKLNLRDIYLPLRASRSIDCSPVRVYLTDDLGKSLKRSSEELRLVQRAPVWLAPAYLIHLFTSDNAVLYHFNEENYYGLTSWKQQPDKTWAPIPAGDNRDIGRF